MLNGPSDLNRDGVPDLIARDKDGVLWFYQGTGGASCLQGPRQGRRRLEHVRHDHLANRRRPARGCARVGGMLAHSIQNCQNWWWTAHPAAH
ncbi:hypothetical protein SVIOM342S_08896 [Streptomyces violaceorubidus]